MIGFRRHIIQRQDRVTQGEQKQTGTQPDSEKHELQRAGICLDPIHLPTADGGSDQDGCRRRRTDRGDLERLEQCGCHRIGGDGVLIHMPQNGGLESHRHAEHQGREQHGADQPEEVLHERTVGAEDVSDAPAELFVSPQSKYKHHG